MNQPQGDSSTQTSRHTIVRQVKHIFSKILIAIWENLTNDQITQNVKHDSQKILAWFIIDYFSHNVDLKEQARKTFRPQSTADETVLAEQSDYVCELNGLMTYLSIDQQIYQVGQLALSQLIKIMLDNIQLQLTQHLKL